MTTDTIPVPRLVVVFYGKGCLLQSLPPLYAVTGIPAISTRPAVIMASADDKIEAATTICQSGTKPPVHFTYLCCTLRKNQMRTVGNKWIVFKESVGFFPENLNSRSVSSYREIPAVPSKITLL